MYHCSANKERGHKNNIKALRAVQIESQVQTNAMLYTLHLSKWTELSIFSGEVNSNTRVTAWPYMA